MGKVRILFFLQFFIEKFLELKQGEGFGKEIPEIKTITEKEFFETETFLYNLTLLDKTMKYLSNIFKINFKINNFINIEIIFF